MIRTNLLSKRYAQAVFDLADETKQIEAVHKDLNLVGKVINENRQLKAVISNPVIDADKKVRILTELFKSSVSTLTMRFLTLITKKGRETYIASICSAYDELFKAYKNIASVKLTTAFKPEETLKKDVIKKLESALKMNIELEEKTDDSIVGGFILNYQDYKYDASILTQLKNLKSVFAHDQYIKKF